MAGEAERGGNRGLDRTDARILRLLEANGRMSYQEMAEIVGLSANAVRARVQAMFARQVIRGIHGDVDWGGGGVKIQALIDIRLRSGANGAAFEHAAVQLPGAVQLDHLAGPTHYCLRVSVTTMDALDELIRDLKERLRADTTTKIITRSLRSVGGIAPLGR